MGLPLVARCLATIINLLFLSCATCLLMITILASFNAPQAVISPERVSEYPQFIVTIIFVAGYSMGLLVLSLVGLISLCFLNSFLLSLFIVGQISMIGVLCISFAFTLTVRNRLHAKLEETWRGKFSCLDGETCSPLEEFRRSETFLIVSLFVFLVLQVVQLLVTAYLCEQRSDKERQQLLMKKADEDDE